MVSALEVVGACGVDGGEDHQDAGGDGGVGGALGGCCHHQAIGGVGGALGGCCHHQATPQLPCAHHLEPARASWKGATISLAPISLVTISLALMILATISLAIIILPIISSSKNKLGHNNKPGTITL